MSYIGEKGVSRLYPEVLFDLSLAKKMFKDKVDTIIIKVKTGWEYGIEGLWRYEIMDLFGIFDY